MKLLDYLGDFRAAMLQKFIERHDRVVRRWGRSVVDDDFDWDNMNLDHIEEHFREEIAEWLQAEPWDRAEEDVDVANMAFLDWVARRHRQGAEE